MKLRITDKDLAELTIEQKQNLCDLWLPQAYDIAVANVCVDAAEEKYNQITFVIGGLNITKHNDIILYDMKFLPDNLFTVTEDSEDNEACAANSAEDSEDTLNDDFSEDFSIDEDFNFEIQRPESFNKQDCLPLLDIGQMIDILERKNFGECEFSLSVAFDDKTFDIGKNTSLSDMYSSDNNCELCDILWLSLKALL